MDKKGVSKKITKQVVKKTVKTDSSTPNIKSKYVKKTQVRKIKDFRVHIEKIESDKKKILKKVKDHVKLDKSQIKQAIDVLKEISSKDKKKTELLDSDDGFIYIEVALNKLPDEYSMRPVQIKLPVPIYSDDFMTRCCIVSKDPQRDYKNKIAGLDIPTFAKVIGYTKLQRNYQQFEEKRKLCKDYDLFFCDYKIYDLLRKPLGKFFYDHKKIPFPIDCEGVPAYLSSMGAGDVTDYEAYLNHMLHYTYFLQSNGPNYSLKIARVSQSDEDIIKNVTDGVTNLLSHM